MNLPQALYDAADVSAVTQLILKERESRDLGRWNDMRDCFHPDAQVRVSWFRGSAEDFIKASIDMASRMVNRHRLAPIHVVLSGNRAVATLSAIVEIPTRLEEVDMMLLIYARFVYRAEKRRDEWRILSFDAIYLRDELTPAISGHTISIDVRELQAFRPTYRLLSYVLSKHGYTIAPDLPGEDRPETVQLLMHEVFAWLGTKPN
jgi:SnoaL-like domain